MINQLFRTNFESNLTPFIVFLALNAGLGFILIQTNFESGSEPPIEFLSGISFWLLIFCFVAAGLSLLRYNRERNSRLYAQLPVTHVQVRMAYWCHASLYLCISSLVLLLVMVEAGIKPLVDLLLFTLLYLSHAGVLLAVLSIITSNTLRLIPEEILRRTVIYFFLATLITFLFLVALGFIVEGYLRAYSGGVERWWLLTLVMTLLCAGLIALDIQLFSRKDSYLG